MPDAPCGCPSVLWHLPNCARAENRVDLTIEQLTALVEYRAAQAFEEAARSERLAVPVGAGSDVLGLVLKAVKEAQEDRADALWNLFSLCRRPAADAFATAPVGTQEEASHG
jgi:hypothetical protein